MSCTNQNQCGGNQKQQKRQVAGDGAHGRTVFDSVYYGRPEYGFYDAAQMAAMGAKVGGCDDMTKHPKQQKQQKQQKGGDGAHGRTVFDSVYYGRPEYGFYDAAQMAEMGAKVGGCDKKKQQKRQVAGDGAHGRTVFDSVYYGRPEYGFYDAAQMAEMGAKVGGHGGCGAADSTVYVVEGSTMNKQSGGSQQKQNSQHKMRIRGIITNMIDVSNSKDGDIVEVLQHELKEDNRTRYTKQEATQILKEYYVFNQEKTKKSMNGNRTYPSNLLEKFIGEHHQKGGNRVTLPLSFFTGEIPDKIVVPPRVDNYCAF